MRLPIRLPDFTISFLKWTVRSVVWWKGVVYCYGETKIKGKYGTTWVCFDILRYRIFTSINLLLCFQENNTQNYSLCLYYCIDETRLTFPCVCKRQCVSGACEWWLCVPVRSVPASPADYRFYVSPQLIWVQGNFHILVKNVFIIIL